MTHQIKLRDYQAAVVDAVRVFVQYRDGINGYVKAPGGSGKSVMIAKVAEAAANNGMRVIILARSEKLLTQNKAKISKEFEVGMYCASLNEADAGKQITVASIQSIAKVTGLKPDLILVDECQNINPDTDSETQYHEFFKACGNPRIIGFTATDFRTNSGEIQWGEKITEVPLQPLIGAGYLVAPINKVTNTPDIKNVDIRLGEFVQNQLEELFLEPELLAASVANIKKYSHDRHSVIIFCQSIRHCHVLRETMIMNGMDATVVHGEIPKPHLAKIYDSFANREFKYIINCQLLTEGIDFPCVDMVAIVRSTVSKGLFEQMVYRGTRPYEGKNNFMLLDMGGNLERHGALGSPYVGKGGREAKKTNGRICPVCETFTPSRFDKQCPDCGFEFPPPEVAKVNHESEHDEYSSVVYTPQSEQTFDVDFVRYTKGKSKKGDVMITAEYMHGYTSTKEYFLPYHAMDFVKHKFWQFLSDANGFKVAPVETYDIEQLMLFCEQSPAPKQIVVKPQDKNPKYTEVTKRIYAEEHGSNDTETFDSLDDEILF